MEGFAVTPVLGVEMRQNLQGFDFGVVAAPECGQRLKLGNDIRPLHVAQLVTRQDVIEAPARGEDAVARFGSGMIGGKRLLVVPQVLRKPAG
jgi:hypothetical protein